MSTLHDPRDFTPEQYVASVKNGSSNPGLFTPENGWHLGVGDDESYRWRALGRNAWAGGLVVDNCFGEWFIHNRVGPELRLEDPRAIGCLRAGLEDAKHNKAYAHPLRPATP